MNILPNWLLQGWNLTQVQESVPKQSSTIALHKSFSQGKYCTQFCLFVLAKQMQACNTQIFGYLWHLLVFSNAFFKTQMWQKAEEYIPSRLVSTALHKSLIQAKYVQYCMEILSVCSGQSNACIQNQNSGYILYILAILLLLKWLF